ncbi:hypothetical protein ACIA8K_07085 [Catenuloplanes sp. NPDC051500]|uniref:hypothetical protein n=1 Tax=Catenuloplanes sp. NPDC051500 TaxID=3363959 RepID=UPI0037B523B4
MPYPTDGYNPDVATYTVMCSQPGEGGSALITISAPAWASLPGWHDTFEAAVAAFRASLHAQVDDLTVNVNRSLTAVNYIAIDEPEA